MLGLEDEDLAVGRDRPGQQVQGVGGRTGEDHLVGRAAAEEVGDRLAGVLEQVGGELREVTGAAVDTAVVRGVRGDVVPDALEGGGAGRVVQGGVADFAAGDQRDGDISPQNGQRGANGLVGGSGGDGHGGTPVTGMRRREKGVCGGGALRP